MGLPIALLVLGRNLYFYYFCYFVYGLGGGGVSVACNAGCLEIWRGRDDGGPPMHAVNFFFAFGALLGPLMAAPLLEVSWGIKINY